ncbi:GPI ethanolamine phosphate transferase 1 [Fusarium phyllophilum]|uniref:GPI ethanolamine phosphate transferase 1 n=1 Tax=Fusarium phyllophilum TaxID=47803 RepID=A0A8H5J5E6_9HYPO|nr:GPI ethanolamine phosphate transferase 1 [Fusarium phyllophilum]
MAGFSRIGFMAIAVAFHLVYIFSIFDIYFVSPIVSGMRLFNVERTDDSPKAPADRLVLFVGDGLRADKAFQAHPEPYPESDEDLVPRPLAPYLRSRVLEHGTFGVSHTRVPTESRPGHVALIAGLYEDVSAVATGWKMNPVNFDSVFNRSRHTWSWGSPDILPMFQHGAVPGRVDAFAYGAELEDFSKDATELDYWVFNHVKDFFAAAATNETLNTALREDKVVFFLHLLGLDTTGHSYRPYSKEYLHNIKVVDQGVKEMVELIEGFYADDRTAYVFTADHGMTDWGSHGDGHPNNTRTPLISWGSGVATPELHPDSIAPGHDEYSSDWNLDHVRRHDVAQADVAALMSYLIGAEFPANGVGQLPLNFLSANIKEKAQASLVNAQVILEQYRIKEESKRNVELRYQAYGPLSNENLGPEQRIAHIRSLMDAGQFEEAIEESDALMEIGLQGLRYLQTYDWLFLRALITVGYLGWMTYATTTVLSLYVVQESNPPQRTLLGSAFFSSVLVALYSSFVVSKSPPAYYLYAFFPVLFWEEVYARRASVAKGFRTLFGNVKSGGAVAALIFNVVLYFGIIQSLAIGYIHREVLTGLFVLESLIGGGLMTVIGLAYLVLEDFILSDFTTFKSKSKRLHTSRTLLGTQIGLIVLAMLVTHSSATSLQAKLGLPRGNQVVGWVVLVVSLLMPLAYRLQPNSHYMHRLAIIFLTCAPTFIILTISYEGLFYVAFSVTLLAWVRLEYAVHAFSKGKAQNEAAIAEQQKRELGTSRPLTLSDARIALFFMVLLQSAFFSTGNIASISSFSLESVSRLIPVFDPFSQGALLILKIIIPFFLISANLGVLNKRLGVAPSALFMVVLTVSDVLTLYFFWVVKDEGSWLEIGSTITHFAIASFLCVFVAALELVSAAFIAGIEVEDEQPAAANGLRPETNGKVPSKTLAG